MKIYIEDKLYEVPVSYMLEKSSASSFLGIQLLLNVDGHLAAPDIQTGRYTLAGDDPHAFL